MASAYTNNYRYEHYRGGFFHDQINLLFDVGKALFKRHQRLSTKYTEPYYLDDVVEKVGIHHVLNYTHNTLYQHILRDFEIERLQKDALQMDVTPDGNESKFTSIDERCREFTERHMCGYVVREEFNTVP